MLYLLLVIGIILIGLSILGCRIGADVYQQLLRQSSDIESLRQKLDGHCKVDGYLHAKTRALIKGDPPPDEMDYLD